MSDAESLVVHYRGGDADRGEFSYYMAAGAMIAFGDFIGEMSRTMYGDKSQVETRVRNIAPEGSILFEFVVQATGAAQAAISGPATPSTLWELFKQSVEAWKFLGGEPPEKIEHRQQENDYALINSNGDVSHVTQNVTVLLNSPEAGKSIEAFLAQPMRAAGVTEVAIEPKGRPERDAIEVSRSEADCFKDISQDELVLKNSSVTALQIESVTFRDGNKWGFFDGENRITAAILDTAFLERIEAGEAFRKGDVLVVELSSEQRVRSAKIQTHHEVIRVQEHRKRSEQMGSSPLK